MQYKTELQIHNTSFSIQSVKSFRWHLWSYLCSSRNSLFVLSASKIKIKRYTFVVWSAIFLKNLFIRTTNTIDMNMMFTLKKPLFNIFVSLLRLYFWCSLILIFKAFVQYFYRYGLIFREVMHSPVIDVCGMIEKYKSNILVQQLIQIANDNNPGLVHACPYTVSYMLLTNIFAKWHFLGSKSKKLYRFIGCCKGYHPIWRIQTNQYILIRQRNSGTIHRSCNCNLSR